MKTRLASIAPTCSFTVPSAGALAQGLDTETDFTNHAGYRTAEEAAGSVIHIATHHEADVTGGFFHEDGTRLPW